MITINFAKTEHLQLISEFELNEFHDEAYSFDTLTDMMKDNYLLKNNSMVLYAIISFIWVACEIIMIVLFYQFKDVDFWFFEILIATFIYSRIFLVQIYKHQKFAIALNLIPTFLKIICLILTVTSTEEIYKKKVIYRHNPLWLIFGILLHPTLTAVISFINCTLKSFLDLK